MNSVWRALDDALGVPVIFASTGTGAVTTNAAVVASRRGAGDAGVLAPGFADEINARLGVTSRVAPEGVIVCDLTESDTWLERLAADPDAVSGIRRAAQDVRASRPNVRLLAGVLPWPELVDVAGEDAAVWAAARSASKAAPLVFGLHDAVIRTRLDDNPLALVRRAHAAAAVGLDLPAAVRTDDPATGAAATTPAGVAVPVSTTDQRRPDARLRAGVLLASRTVHDADGARARPALLAVEGLARAVLAHLESAPVTRTDLLALSVARSILAETLDAVGVAAPVPY